MLNINISGVLIFSTLIFSFSEVISLKILNFIFSSDFTSPNFPTLATTFPVRLSERAKKGSREV
jgi:hypothetical protein